MPVKTKRWNDPASAADGVRILVCRYRPRGVRKQDETWHEWQPALAPSRELHADWYGKKGPPISWKEFCARYLQEMAAQDNAIEELARRSTRRQTLTLLCSSACVDATRCHRMLLQQLIEKTRRGGQFGEC